MPYLIIEDDNRRELFRGALSAENLEIVAGFVGRHLETFRGIAAFKQALDRMLAEHVAAVGPEPAPRPRRRRR